MLPLGSKNRLQSNGYQLFRKFTCAKLVKRICLKGNNIVAFGVIQSLNLVHVTSFSSNGGISVQLHSNLITHNGLWGLYLNKQKKTTTTNKN